MSKVVADPTRVSVPAIASIPPEVPRGPAAEAELKWKRQKMTRWLSPTQLAATGVRAVLSSVFGAYADRREVQAALHQLDTAAVPADPDSAHFDGLVFGYADRADPENGFWIDFVADLGDGFDSTYTVAWMLGQPTLPLPGLGQDAAVEGRPPMGPGRTRRGSILVMGGDQVYPTASRDEYANRLAGPYEAALPWCSDAPHLFAIPGNHDWYDGLTSFMRLFCQQRWIGAWKTQQHRSYFALQLPDHWWLLGVDVQLESDIDQPQIEYFCKVAQERMQPGDRVILVTAEPAWVHTPTEPAAFDNLAFFEKTVLAPRGVELALTLTGDLHHYSRYTSVERAGEEKHHKITAGGGGAYLLGTQMLDDHIELTAPEAQPRGPAQRTEHGRKERYDRKCVYPSMDRSLWLKVGSLKAGWKNPSFAVFMGMVYMLYAWFLQSASQTSAVFPTSFMEETRVLGPGDWARVGGFVWRIAAHEPLVMAFSLLLIVAFIAFCAPDVERSRLLRQSKVLQMVMKVGVGGAHGFAHLSLAVSLLWLVAVVDLGPGDITDTDSPTKALLFAVQMLVVGAPLGALLMGIFLLPFVNYNEAFSSQHLEEYKNFLRLHLQPDGRLAVYPYGVDDPARWRFRPEAEAGTPYFEPHKAPRVRLLDGPIVLAAPASFNPAAEEAGHGD